MMKTATRLQRLERTRHNDQVELWIGFEGDDVLTGPGGRTIRRADLPPGTRHIALKWGPDDAVKT